MAGQFVDKQLACVDCGADFVHSAQSQEKFVELGFTNEPKRCGPCRAAKKKANGDSGGSTMGRGNNTGPRETHVAVCATCGGEAHLPFKPRGDKPVYCSSCFGRR